MALSPGTRLGPYEILAPLGAGGMGEVYRAKDHKLGRQVAVKVLPNEVASDSERLKRFEREARAASSLNHPNTVTIHDVDEQDGTHYIAMELVEGKTLRKRLSEGRLSPEETLRVATQIARGLAKAHGAGIVHRDLKPGNIMISDDGVVKILDFGLAKQTLPDDEAPSELTTVQEMTRPGVVLGTTPYMSPEQAAGRPVDFRSDQFSFGAILYEMVTGRAAFERDTPQETLAAVLDGQTGPLRDLGDRFPPALAAVIERCLSRDARGRYDSTGDLAKELEGLPATGSRATRPLPRAGALVAALALVAAGLYWASTRPEEAKPLGSSPGPLVVVPLTSYPGEEAEPSFSPDGSQVAFSWEGVDRFSRDIYVKAIGSEEPLRLTTHPAVEGSPAWSPDGRQIALLRAREGGGSDVLLVPPTGGTARQVGAVASPPDRGLSWAPDGRTLALLDHPPEEGPALGVFLLDVASASKTQLTVPPDPTTRGDSMPTYSPDGGTIAFFREGGMIHLVPAGGGQPRALVSVMWKSRVAWASGGDQVVFSAVPSRPRTGPPQPSQSYSGSPVLWRTGLDPVAPQQLSGPTNAFEVEVSRAGNRLAYTKRRRAIDIWRIDLSDSRSSGDDSQVAFLASTQIDGNPQHSLDDQRIAFTSSRTGHNEIWLSDSAGENLLRLTDLGREGEAGSPAWSPDGQSVAFDFRREGGGRDYDVYTVSTSGGAPRRVTSTPSRDVTPSWSRDGAWIYFSSDRGGQWQIWKVAADSESDADALQVTRGGGYAPKESPGGEYLYFARRRSFPEDPENSIWRVRVGGGEEEVVVESLRSGWGNWDVTDDAVYFVDAPSPHAAGWVLMRLRLGERTAAQVAKLRFEPGLGGPAFSVSSDGRWALSVQSRRESDLMLVEDFR